VEKIKKESRIKKHAKVLRAFISIYCRENHLKKNRESFIQGYCYDCYKLLEYALNQNDKCPLNPKPLCKNCEVHCYNHEMRKKIKEVMKFSGIYYIKRGRLDWVFHYFF